VIEIPVPGLTPDQITIEVTPEMVTVSTQPQEEPSDSGRRYLQREQPAQPMSRIFEFPEELDTDNVWASLESGVLKSMRRRPPPGGAG
jgi:HSP20 family molecular chaperone IbpA